MFLSMTKIKNVSIYSKPKTHRQQAILVACFLIFSEPFIIASAQTGTRGLHTLSDTTGYELASQKDSTYSAESVPLTHIPEVTASLSSPSSPHIESSVSVSSSMSAASASPNNSSSNSSKPSANTSTVAPFKTSSSTPTRTTEGLSSQTSTTTSELKSSQASTTTSTGTSLPPLSSTSTPSLKSMIPTTTTTTTTTTTQSLFTKLKTKVSTTMTSTSSQQRTKNPERRLLPDYSIYHNTATLNDKIQDLAQKHPHLMKVDSIGKTKNNNDITALTLKNFKKYRDSTPQVRILMTFGTYGNQIFPTESMLYLITKLIDGYHINNEFSQKLFNYTEMIIFPLWNIDDRIEMEQTMDYCNKLPNKTVDLERNFDWEFKETRIPSYSGRRAFTEKETEALKNVIDKDKFDMYLTFNTGSRRSILFPFTDMKSNRTKRKPDNYKSMGACAHKAAKTLETRGKSWLHGMAWELLPGSELAGGRSADYIIGEKRVPFGYTVGLWAPEARQGNCFLDRNPKNENLEAELEQVFPLYESLFDCMWEWKATQKPPRATLPFPFEDDILNYGLIAIVTFVLLSITIYFCRSKSCTCCGCCKRRPRNKYYDESSMNYNLLDISDDEDEYIDSDDTQM